MAVGWFCHDVDPIGSGIYGYHLDRGCAGGRTDHRAEISAALMRNLKKANDQDTSRLAQICRSAFEMRIKEAFKLPEILFCLMHVRREQILCVRQALENN
jgi:hypothetical protein